MGIYTELRARHQKEYNAFPIHFAFGDDQINAKISELKLSKDPQKRAKQIVAIGCGGFVLKKDYPAYHDMCKRHCRERAEAMANDEKNGTGYLYDMFHSELINHEYGYTCAYDDTLVSLGLTLAEVNANPRMKAALEQAAFDIRQANGYEF